MRNLYYAITGFKTCHQSFIIAQIKEAKKTMPKYKVLRVTTTRDYLVEMIDDEKTKINGWTIKEVIEDWFHDHPLEGYHATRDGCRIGNSKKFIKVEVEDL
jgi:hypothetical protein